jgi:hypothetical protein
MLAGLPGHTVPLTTRGDDRSGCAVSIESFEFGSAPGIDSSSVTSGNVPSVNNRMFEIPEPVSMRIGYTPGAASAFNSTRNDAPRTIVPGVADAITGVNVAGIVVVIRAPSPIFRPIAVSVNARPISAPRGFNSVITGAAANTACAASMATPIRSVISYPQQPRQPAPGPRPLAPVLKAPAQTRASSPPSPRHTTAPSRQTRPPPPPRYPG